METREPVDLHDWLALPVEHRARCVGSALARAREITRTHHAYIAVAAPSAEISRHGELAGVPFAVKDNIDVAGFATTAGSPLLGGQVAEVDADIVSLLRDAGGVVSGKANMHELAFGVTSDNATYGPVRNPFDPDRAAGGSSGGSAVAVALGSVPFSLGTDTGGSVLIPSAFCGIAGFRPTTGRYPGAGVVNLSTTRDTVGIHAKSASEILLVDGVVTRSAAVEERRPSDLILGRVLSRFAGIDDEVAGAVERWVITVRELGATVVDVDLGDDLEIAAQAGELMVRFEAERLIPLRADARRPARRRFEQYLEEIASADVRDILRDIAEHPVSAQDYEHARRTRWHLRRRYELAFDKAGADALIGPTCAVLPPLLGRESVTVGNREAPIFATVIRNSGPGTFAGVPMLSVPAGVSPGGLPVGVTLEGRPFADRSILSHASALQRAMSSVD